MQESGKLFIPVISKFTIIKKCINFLYPLYSISNIFFGHISGNVGSIVFYFDTILLFVGTTENIPSEI
jgi:hypothetical protein